MRYGSDQYNNFKDNIKYQIAFLISCYTLILDHFCGYVYILSK